MNWLVRLFVQSHICALPASPRSMLGQKSGWKDQSQAIARVTFLTMMNDGFVLDLPSPLS